jgi:copper(I)-binding protein
MTTTWPSRPPRPVPATSRSTRPAHRTTLTVALLVALAGAGCDGDDGEAADTAARAADASTSADAARATEGASATSADGTISASGAWVRVAIRPAGSDEPGAPPVNSAGYVVLRNAGAGADALMTVETEVADTAELHSVSMEGGIMRMRPVDSIPVPTGGEAVLEPGGYHIMLIGLRSALAEGDSVAMMLRFRSGAVVELVAPVRRQ